MYKYHNKSIAILLWSVNIENEEKYNYNIKHNKEHEK